MVATQLSFSVVRQLPHAKVLLAVPTSEVDEPVVLFSLVLERDSVSGIVPVEFEGTGSSALETPQLYFWELPSCDSFDQISNLLFRGEGKFALWTPGVVVQDVSEGGGPLVSTPETEKTVLEIDSSVLIEELNVCLPEFGLHISLLQTKVPRARRASSAARVGYGLPFPSTLETEESDSVIPAFVWGEPLDGLGAKLGIQFSNVHSTLRTERTSGSLEDTAGCRRPLVTFSATKLVSGVDSSVLADEEDTFSPEFAGNLLGGEGLLSPVAISAPTSTKDAVRGCRPRVSLTASKSVFSGCVRVLPKKGNSSPLGFESLSYL